MEKKITRPQPLNLGFSRSPPHTLASCPNLIASPYPGVPARPCLLRSPKPLTTTITEGAEWRRGYRMLWLIRVFNCLAFYFSLIPILSPQN